MQNLQYLDDNGLIEKHIFQGKIEAEMSFCWEITLSSLCFFGTIFFFLTADIGRLIW